MDLQLAPLPAPSGDQKHPATGHTAIPSQPSTTTGWSLPAMNEPQQQATWTHGTRGGRWGCRLGCCLTVRSASWEEISMWFPVFCECFALCLLFNSCLHAQHFITYGCLMKTFLSCFWLQAFTMCFNPPSNSCCTCWLTAVPGELPPGCDIPAGVATGGVAANPPSYTSRHSLKKISINVGVSFLVLMCPTVKCSHLFTEKR